MSSDIWIHNSMWKYLNNNKLYKMAGRHRKRTFNCCTKKRNKYQDKHTRLKRVLYCILKGASWSVVKSRFLSCNSQWYTVFMFNDLVNVMRTMRWERESEVVCYRMRKHVLIGFCYTGGKWKIICSAHTSKTLKSKIPILTLVKVRPCTACK